MGRDGIRDNLFAEIRFTLVFQQLAQGLGAEYVNAHAGQVFVALHLDTVSGE